MTITLKTLEQATEQEVFDQVCNHLMEQDVASINDSSTCLYRHGTLKCAAGCLISDEEYHPDMEDNAWMGLVKDGHVPTDKHKGLIDSLQGVHDDSCVDEWPEMLEDVADHYGLKLPQSVVDRLPEEDL